MHEYEYIDILRFFLSLSLFYVDKAYKISSLAYKIKCTNRNNNFAYLRN